MTDAQEPADSRSQPGGEPWDAVPPGYGPPPGYPTRYQQGDPYGYPPPAGGTNGLALASMVLGICGFLCLVPGLVGIVLGFVSLPQIRRTRQRGRGMAIAGILLGFFWPIAFALSVVAESRH